MELAISGRMMEAEEAFRLGLIHRLVAPEMVLPAAIAIARELAAKPAVALRVTKEYLRRANEDEYERAWRWAAEGQAAAFATGDPQAVMRAFLAERRSRK